MTHAFHPEALAEYEKAARYYARRNPRAAERFIAAIDEAIEGIVEAPFRWRLLEEDVRRCLAHVFPYAVLYTIEPDFILVVAVMHCARKPGYWRRRL